MSSCVETACRYLKGSVLPESDITPHDGAAFPTAEELAEWLPQYEIGSRIFSGMHSAIYLARQPALERQVMIRVMPEPGPEMAPLLMERLRTRARLVHPMIVSVFDFGRTLGGPLYLVTEHVDGSMLNALIHEKKVTPKQAYHLAVQLCETLQVVHDHRVIHGALSSQTVLVAKDGQLKLTGIGMMETADGELSWLGDSTATFDDDIDALGRVIHEMFCGKPPGPGGEISRALPPAFARVIERCIDPEPSRRFAEPGEVKAALAQALHLEKQAAAGATAPKGVAPMVQPASGVTGPVPAAPRPGTGVPPPRVQPGQVPRRVYEPPPRRSFMRRVDDFLWGVLRTSLHLVIFGGTLLIIGAYVLLKDKIVFVDPEEEAAAKAEASNRLGKDSASLKELDERYVVAVRNAARTAATDERNDEARVLQRELERVEKGGPMPELDPPNMPDFLKRLRAEYRKERARLEPPQQP